jgi:hypothetical protein
MLGEELRLIQRAGGMDLRRALFLALMSAFVLAATAPMCRAQGEDNDDDDARAGQHSASLNLTFDNQGNANVHLLLDQSPRNWQLIQAALSLSLHCPPQAFAHPSTTPSSGGWVSPKPEQQAQYKKFLTEANQRQLQASCSQVLTASGWTVSGSLPLHPLADALAASGEQLLLVNVQRPRSGFEKQSSQGLQLNRFASQRENTQFLFYSYPLGTSTLVMPLRLTYGYRNADLMRQCAMSAGFLLLPLLLILGMRHAALRDALQDPTAAWFSYFKTLQWCVNGTMLLWMVARTSLRQGGAGSGDISATPGRMAIHHRPYASGHRSTVARVLVLSFPFLQGVRTVSRQAMGTAPVYARALAGGGGAISSLNVLLLRAGPEALTTGELRDRVFEMAKRSSVSDPASAIQRQRSSVKVKQVFVLSSGRMQVANANATGGQTVMFTDYLLQRLSKREGDAIAGHELSHLRHGHPKKLGLTMIAVILFPSIFRGTWTMFTDWISELLTSISGGDRGVLIEWYRWTPSSWVGRNWIWS